MEIAQGSSGDARSALNTLELASELAEDGRITGEAVAGALQRKLTLMRYGLQGLIADGMILRVSSVGADSAPQFALQAAFIGALLAALPGPLRSRFAGLEGLA